MANKRTEMRHVKEHLRTVVALRLAVLLNRLENLAFLECDSGSSEAKDRLKLGSLATWIASN